MRRLSALPALLLLLGCVDRGPTGGVVAPPVVPVLAGDAPLTLDQGWSDELAARFHFTPQGSQLIPRRWFLALTDAEGLRPFREPDRLRGYGLLYAAPGSSPALNPDGLPIGFAVDPAPREDGEPWLGPTCAACHTGRIASGARVWRVEGGSALFDFDRFGADLDAAVQATRADPSRFAAFAARVGADPDALRPAFDAYAQRSARVWSVQRPQHASGFGRVDALGQIVNALAVLNLDAPRAVQDGNRRAPRAPVSYPALWGTPAQDFVQYAPVASSPIGRNAGEVLGVFGEVALTDRRAAHRYRSSILYRELHELENWVRALRPPAWPEAAFGAIDPALWAAGRRLFAADCNACHNTLAPQRRTEARDSVIGETSVRVSAVPGAVIGTDPTYHRALAEWRIDPGPLADLFQDARQVGAPQFFGATVFATVQDNLRRRPLLGVVMFNSGETRMCPSTNRSTANAPRPPILAYEIPSPCTVERGVLFAPERPWRPPGTNWAAFKAGPLHGAWATAPYLHNGSVPTLDDLLRPPAERPAVFWTGSAQFDPVRIGFDHGPGPGLFRFDTNAPGNGRQGHAYPPQPYDAAQRRAMLEFLKDAGRSADGQ